MPLLETQIQCPYCWQVLTIFVEPDQPHHSYVEDCQVCCSPILIHLETGERQIHYLDAERENA